MAAINETEVEIHGLPVNTSKVNSCRAFLDRRHLWHQKHLILRSSELR